MEALTAGRHGWIPVADRDPARLVSGLPLLAVGGSMVVMGATRLAARLGGSEAMMGLMVALVTAARPA